MDITKSILLGALQGIAEFLPISSSGHLAVAKSLFGMADVPLLFDIMLHVATLLAVIIFFRKKIAMLCLVLFRWITRQKSMESTAHEDAYRGIILALFATTAVTGVIGVFTAKFIPDLGIKLVCAGFLLTAALLILSSIANVRQQQKLDAEKNDNTEQVPQKLTVLQGIIIGIAQGIGTLPGVSRSGSTIAGALLCGVDRSLAGEYSFIAAIPAIAGAFLLEAKDLGAVEQSVGIVPLTAGCAVSFIVGYISLALLQKIIKSGRLHWFAAYLIPAGILGLLFLK